MFNFLKQRINKRFIFVAVTLPGGSGNFVFPAIETSSHGI
jgi:hypothetical protein